MGESEGGGTVQDLSLFSSLMSLTILKQVVYSRLVRKYAPFRVGNQRSCSWEYGSVAAEMSLDLIPI